MAPSLANTVVIDGWPIIGVQELARKKIISARGKDITDVIWLCSNRKSDVLAAAARINYRSRVHCASEVRADYPRVLVEVCEVLDVDPADVP